MSHVEEMAGVFLSQAEAEIDDNEKYIVMENMRTYGGGFVKALGEALGRADANNTRRIKNAFPDYWQQYKNFGG